MGKEEKDTITVYWSPGQFTNSEPYSWNQFYSEPTLVSEPILEQRQKDPTNRVIFGCPAYVEGLKNVYEVRSVHSEDVTFPHDLWKNLPTDYPQAIPTNSKLGFQLVRLSSIEGHVDLTYNMSWLFFADEPIEARFTAPYFPPKSPAKNGLLAIGTFNIGMWFRQFNLDYMVPQGSNRFVIEDNDPLFYVQFLTTKKIVFKRFVHTDALQKLAEEFAQTSNRRHKKMGVTFTSRYALSKKTKLPELVLSEIKKNLVE